jgi:hypothetical protein
MRRLLYAALFLAPSAAAAQEYLTPDAFAALTTGNALCYALRPDGSCGWVELYDGDPGPEITLHVATILASGEVAVLAQQATWVGDAMCIRDGDFGILGMDYGVAPYFRFDLTGLVAQPQSAVQGIIEQLTPDIRPKTCFRFTADPTRADGYVQHIFSDGVRLDSEDAITLVPLAQGSVLLAPPGG